MSKNERPRTSIRRAEASCHYRIDSPQRATQLQRVQSNASLVCLTVPSAQCDLAFWLSGVATPIALFVSFEVVLIDTLRRLGLLAAVWLCALIAVLWI